MKYLGFLFVILLFVCLVHIDSGSRISDTLVTCYDICSTRVKNIVQNTSDLLFQSRRPGYCETKFKYESADIIQKHAKLRAIECHSRHDGRKRIDTKTVNESRNDSGIIIADPDIHHSGRTSSHHIWILLVLVLFCIQEEKCDHFWPTRFQHSCKSRFGRKLFNQLFNFRHYRSRSVDISNFSKLHAYPFTINQIATEIVQNGRSASELMNYEWSRYLSFTEFPLSSPVTPMRLSQAGFYYTGNSDNVKCFSCGVTHGQWRRDDDAFQIHSQISPECTFVRNQNTSNIPIHVPEFYTDINQRYHRHDSTESTSSPPAVDLLDSLRQEGQDNNRPTQDSQGANAALSNNLVNGHNSYDASTNLNNQNVKHPEYASVSKREESFSNWTFSDVQNPKTLAKSGLFYTGFKDMVRCFSCGVGLKEWSKDDVPLVEHARWSTNCEFLKSVNTDTTISQPASQPKQNVNEKVISPKTGRPNAEKKKHSSEAQSLLAENRALRDQRVCKKCRKRDANVVYLPCGHMVTCSGCAANTADKCSVCGSQVKGEARVFQS